MNSKERVKSALSLEVPDRIPYGEYAVDFDTIKKILGHETYLRAKAKSQVALWEGRRDEVVQSWKEDMVEFYKKMDCIDIVNLCAFATGIVPPKGYDPNSPQRIDENTWEDREGRIYKYTKANEDIIMIHDPLMWERNYTAAEYEKEPPDIPPDHSVFEVVDYVIERLGGDKYILGPSGHQFEMVMLGEMERALCEYAMSPDVIRAAAVYYMKKGFNDDKYYIRKGQDATLWGQDFSYKTGPLISPASFRELVLPFAKERITGIKDKYRMPVIKHACGNNWELMDMFLEIGYDCYQSIQYTASMDIKDVKEKYGDRICLWGGMPLEALIGGTRDEIKEYTAYAVESAKAGGGFIFGSSHSVAVGTNYDNYMTMLDEFEKVRDY